MENKKKNFEIYDSVDLSHCPFCTSENVKSNGCKNNVRKTFCHNCGRISGCFIKKEKDKNGITTTTKIRRILGTNGNVDDWLEFIMYYFENLFYSKFGKNTLHAELGYLDLTAYKRKHKKRYQRWKVILRKYIKDEQLNPIIAEYKKKYDNGPVVGAKLLPLENEKYKEILEILFENWMKKLKSDL